MSKYELDFVMGVISILWMGTSLCCFIASVLILRHTYRKTVGKIKRIKHGRRASDFV